MSGCSGTSPAARFVSVAHPLRLDYVQAKKRLGGVSDLRKKAPALPTYDEGHLAEKDRMSPDGDVSWK